MREALEKLPIKKIGAILLHRHLIVLLVIAPIIIGIVAQRTLSSIGDTGNAFQEEDVQVSVPDFDPDLEILKRIQDLNSQDIEVNSQFQENRNNPFEN